jgi:hypothetical protein
MSRSRTLFVLFFGVFFTAGASGCATTAKYVVRPVIAMTQIGGSPQDRVFANLVRAAEGTPDQSKWNFETPHRLRPCCAFGTELSVRVGYLPIAGLRLGNLLNVNDLGKHGYNSGLVSLKNEPSSAFVSAEKNGLIYTCRGGFIDTAHVRDYADWMVYLVGRVRKMIDSGGTIVLPSEGGKRFVHVGAISPHIIEEVGREELAIRLAQWAAIHLAIWHETATWYGWSSWGLFPETASAFSPEDLYSNMVGIMIASELIREDLADNDAQYNEAMNVAFPEVLRRLGGAPAEITRSAIRSVDGRWWDSTKPLPDKEVVLRRSFDIGPEIYPWKPPMGRTVDARRVREFCDGDPRPIPLAYETKIEGEPVHYMVRLEVHPENKLAELLAAYKTDGVWVAQEEFPAIVKRARREAREEFGDTADRP